MDPQRKARRATSGAGPMKDRSREGNGEIGHDPPGMQGVREHQARHPSEHARRSRCAFALLKQGSVELAIDQFNTALCIADEEVKARFRLACQLIDRGHPREALRFLREASRVCLQRAMIRYALETAYYDHSIVELAVDEWRAILGLRADAGARPVVKGLDRATC